MTAQVIQGDCLQVMRELESGSIDMILCDLPYGTTDCKWDAVIPLAPLWAEYERLIKPNGAIVLTAAQPFTSALVMSNPKRFRHSWVWLKSHASNFMNAKTRPMAKHEDVLVFSIKPVLYFPQMTIGPVKHTRSGKLESQRLKDGAYGRIPNLSLIKNDTYYPTTPLHFPSGARKDSLHPTQKPVALFEYLIRTYTEPGALVLDNCAGSGTTGVAALQCGRRAILIEQDEKYVRIIHERLRSFQPALLGAS